MQFIAIICFALNLLVLLVSVALLLWSVRESGVGTNVAKIVAYVGIILSLVSMLYVLKTIFIRPPMPKMPMMQQMPPNMQGKMQGQGPHGPGPMHQQQQQQQQQQAPNSKQ